MTAKSSASPLGLVRRAVGQTPFGLLRSPLARRMAAVIFLAILAIEAIILLPSYEQRRERQIEGLIRFNTQWVQSRSAVVHRDVLPETYLRALLEAEAIEGAALYGQDGERRARVGEPLQTADERLVPVPAGEPNWRSIGERRLEAILLPMDTARHDTLVLRLDRSAVDADLRAFVWRIVGLTLIISAVLTAATLIAMGVLVLKPLMALRNLLADGENPENARLYAAELARRDEIGDVFRTTSKALSDLAAFKADLGNLVLERTMELTEANGRLRANEAQMRASEARIRAIMDNSPSFIYLKSVDGRYLVVNRHVEEALGRPADEIVGRRNEDFYPTDLARRYAAQDEEVIASKATVVQEIEVPRADGGSRTSIIYKFPIFGTVGEVESIGAVIVDIDDRKRAENELKQAKEQAEQLLKSKSDLIATVSHEVRTPMNGVLGMARLLREAQLNADERENLEMVISSAESLLRIVNDLLDISKLEAGHLELEAIPFVAANVVDYAAAILAEKAREKDLDLVVTVDPDMPDVLEGDPHRIQQILMNLISNAIKFTAEGRVEVALHPVAPADGGARQFEFSVSDTGNGIAPEVQRKLFSPFTQGATDVARKYGGTGLGLAICRRLAELMDSEITLASAPGRGSRFAFRLALPVLDDVPAEALRASLGGLAGTADAPARPARSLSVLQVEDNETNRLVVEKLLRSAGHRVQSVPDGARALAALDADPDIDLLIIDRHMPVMDGIEATRRIRALPAPLNRIPILGMTAGALDHELAACLEAGMDTVLTKPFDQQKLFHTLAQLTDDAGSTAGTAQADTARDRRPVLVVDDVAVNLNVARKQLESLGIACETCDSADEALIRMKSGGYAAVLLDREMPDLDGLELTRRLRTWEDEQAVEAPLPVIGMSGHIEKSERDACLAAGMNGYLTKPVAIEDLQAAVSGLGLASDGFSHSRSDPSPVVQTAPDAGPPPIDLASLARTLGTDDPETLREILDLFVEMFPPLLDELERAVTARDASALHATAHAAKGAAANAAAGPLAALLDRLAGNGEWEERAQWAEQACNEFVRIREFQPRR